MSKSKNIEIGKNVIQIEADALLRVKEKIDNDFNKAVNLCYNTKGKIVVIGMGKSGIVGQKITATLASTGTQSQFIHPAEALHGDIGMVSNNDTIITISKSGETYEIIQLIPVLKKMGIPIISMVGKINSTIGKNSDIVLDVSVDREACTLELAPTASTTASLAMGDALAITLLEKRKFNPSDFAKLHPAGSLGKKLLLTVDQIMHSGDELPIVNKSSKISSMLLLISEKRLGLAIIVDDKNNLCGIITDGDIRRGFEKNKNLYNKTAEFLISSKKPNWVSSDTLAIDALRLMEKFSITSLLVYEKDYDNSVPQGLIHIHDLIKTGIG